MSFSDNQPIYQNILYDEYGTKYAVYDGYLIPDGTPNSMISGIDEYGICRRFTLIEDESVENLWRLAISGKVSIQISPPPAGGESVSYYADNPLSVSQSISPHITSYIIPNGKKMFIQQVVAGCQGDPTENGSKVEIVYNNGTEHLIERVYVMGETQFGSYHDTDKARDGTELLGNGTNTIQIKRYRLSNSSQEVDAIVRGYII